MRAKGRVAVAACMKEGGKNKQMTDDAVQECECRIPQPDYAKIAVT